MGSSWKERTQTLKSILACALVAPAVFDLSANAHPRLVGIVDLPQPHQTRTSCQPQVVQVAGQAIVAPLLVLPSLCLQTRIHDLGPQAVEWLAAESADKQDLSHALLLDCKRRQLCPRRPSSIWPLRRGQFPPRQSLGLQSRPFRTTTATVGGASPKQMRSCQQRFKGTPTFAAM